MKFGFQHNFQYPKIYKKTSYLAQNNRKFILKTSVIYGDKINQSKRRFSEIDSERLYRNLQSDTNGVSCDFASEVLSRRH